MANEIVWYDSNEVGAPTLNNAAGSLIAVLDACLRTGFNQQTLTSIVVASNVATVTLAGHGYADQRMVEISGAATGAINGRKLITVTGTGVFTFPAPGVADGTIGGTLVAKRSPLGWTKPLTGTNKAIFQRSDPTATTVMLHVTDTSTGSGGSNHARAQMIESYVGIDSFTTCAGGPSGGHYWPRGFADDTTAKPWVLVGDGRTMYFFSDATNGSPSASSYAGGSGGLQACWFGDFFSYRNGDAFNTLCAGPPGTSINLSQAALQTFTPGASPANSGDMHVARASTQLAGSGVQVGCVGPGAGWIVAQTGPVYPSPVDNGLDFNYPVRLAEVRASFGHPIRGYLRGVYHPLGLIGRTLHLQVLSSLTGTAKKLLCVAVSPSSSAGSPAGAPGCVALDITGPWD